MSESMLTPADEGTPDIFDLMARTSAGALGSGTTSSESTSVDTHGSTAAYPTRRELRAQHAAASVAPRRRDGSRRDARSGLRRTKAAQPEIAAYVPQPTRRARPKVMSLLVITAVGGLFASAALPAYALTASGELDPSLAPTALSAARTLAVSADVEAASSKREAFGATSPANLAQLRSNAVEAANYEAYQDSGARELGDDYPFYSELSDDQGGGLSPLNYFYRECVDFVAWRLNRDAGSTEAPFLLDWSYLTPNGGDASAWAGNWDAHGWDSGSEPEVGAVAWFLGNHVAYVTAVNDDGTILIEEYNWGSDHQYHQRTIAATDVARFLYAPPVTKEQRAAHKEALATALTLD